MTDLPTGTITFLFTDIEGSTRLLRALGARFRPVLERHHELVRAALADHGGVEVSTEGDSFFCVFETAARGLNAAVAVQRSLAAEAWPADHPLRVRAGVHTGVAALGGDNYVGLDVHRAARIGAVGHGGQVLVSAAARLLGEAELSAGVAFLDLGEFHLKDFDHTEHLYQLVIEGLPSSFPPLQKLDEGPTNLPKPATSFVGRDRERQEVEKLLDASRIVTITGVAGAGKSRLAVETAAGMRGVFHDGVWVAELAAVSDSDLVAHSVASAMGLQESPGHPALDVLAQYLRQGSRLLVLDNCEHVLEGVGHLASRLVAGAPDLRILATSRQLIGISGETHYPCPPLEMPDPFVSTAADLLDFDAIELFVTRAKEVNPAFTAEEVDPAVIAAICTRLDGMPLAIELAAGLLRVLSPQEILRRLDRRFELLTGGPRTAPTHQQTLRAALDATFEQLDETQREFAARLGVFSGGFNAEAAEVVASGGSIDEADVIDLLSSLVDRSLATSVPRGETVRLTILESVRQYLLEELERRGELEERQLAHAKYFGSLTDAAAMGLRGPDQDRWAERLDANIDNVRSAIGVMAAAGDTAALRLVDRMFLFWVTRGDLSDGLHWARLALQSTPNEDSGLRARVLSTAGYWAADVGEMSNAIANLEEGLAMARRTGDVHAEGYCSSFLGTELSRKDQDLDRGLELLSAAQRIYGQLEEPYGLAWVHRYLALSHQERGDLDESIRLQTLSLKEFRQAGDVWNIRYSQVLLGEAMHTIGELTKSRELYDESLRGSSGTRFKNVIAHALKGLGKVSLAEGRLDEAFDHLGEALSELSEMGDVACVAEATGHLGMANLGRGNLIVAGELLEESLRTLQGMHDQGGVAWSLERLAAVAAAGDTPARAAQMLAASHSIRERTGSQRPGVDEPDVARLAAKLQDQLGEDAYDTAWAEGWRLSLDEAVSSALEP